MATQKKSLLLPRTYRGVKREGTNERYTYTFPGGVIITELKGSPRSPVRTFWVAEHDRLFVEPTWTVFPVDPVSTQDGVTSALHTCFRWILNHWRNQAAEADEKLQQLSKYL